MKNKLTVNLVTYNHEKYISRCIDSLLSQKTDFGYIIRIFDDCSTDGTSEICREYVDKYPDIIQFFPNEKNMGSTLNSIRSYKNIETPYYMFIEGDDYCCNDRKFQLQVDILENNPDCSYCCHNARMQDENGISEGFFPGLKPGKYTIEDVNDSTLYFQSHLCSRIVRTDAISIEMEHPEYYLFDITQAYDLFRRGNMFFLEDIMTMYFVTNEGAWTSLSIWSKIKTLSEAAFAYNKYTKGIFEKNLLNNFLIQINFAFAQKYCQKKEISETKTTISENRYLLWKLRIRKFKHYILPPIILDIGNIPRDLGRKLKKIKFKKKG